MNNKYGFTRQKFQYCRIILLTSLFWVLVDAFLIIYLSDCNKQPQPVLVEEPLNNAKEVEQKQRELQLTEYINRFKQSQTLSYQFSSKNERAGNFLDKLKMWFREDTETATNPPYWPGEQGKAVVIPPKLKAETEKRFKENQFNIVASDMIALNRSVPDQRSEACRKREYPVDLPTTSIIIVYHNEGNSTLLRGLVSIVRKSPLRYLKEIILVDDASENREYLHKPLDNFVKTLPVPVKIFRNKERLGLMRSRLVGAQAAIGDTMTFLDAHIECTDGWLPPLLTEIRHNRKTITCPVIDVISDDTFEYLTGSEMTWGGFDSRFVFDWVPVPQREDRRRENDRSRPIRHTIVSPIIDVISDENFAYLTGSVTNWGGFDHKMVFRWYPIPKRELERNAYDNSLPSRTPTMAGGLFTIDRDYFYELGAYDEGMDIWGAENLEMSFRAWMCGGNLLIIPCSHVGHVFRKQTPYSFPGGTNKIIYRNNRRLIDVWTDEYSKYFHKVIPELNTVEAGDISPRVELRKKLKCHSFKWYLTNIYPEAPIPHDFYHVGEIQNVELNFCIDSMGRKVNEDAGASFCHGQGGNQVFEYSKQHQIATSNICLDTNSAVGIVKLVYCANGLRSQQWDYDNHSLLLRNRQTGSCLAINERDNNALITIACDKHDQLQKWKLKDNLFPVEQNVDSSNQ